MYEPTSTNHLTESAKREEEYEHQMNTIGFFQVERIIWQNPLLRRPDYLSVWIWLQSQAIHGKIREGESWRNATSGEAKCVMFGGRRIALKSNELVCGRKQISKTFSQDPRHKISESTIQNILLKFEQEGMIKQLTSNEKRLIKVINPHPTPLTSDDIKHQKNRNKPRNKLSKVSKKPTEDHFINNDNNESNNDSYDSNVKNHKNIKPVAGEVSSFSAPCVIGKSEDSKLPSQPTSDRGVIDNNQTHTKQAFKYLAKQFYTDLIAKEFDSMMNREAISDWFIDFAKRIDRYDTSHYDWWEKQIINWCDYCIGDILEGEEKNKLHWSFEEWVSSEHAKDIGEGF